MIFHSCVKLPEGIPRCIAQDDMFWWLVTNVALMFGWFDLIWRNKKLRFTEFTVPCEVGLTCDPDRNNHRKETAIATLMRKIWACFVAWFEGLEDVLQASCCLSKNDQKRNSYHIRVISIIEHHRTPLPALSNVRFFYGIFYVHDMLWLIPYDWFLWRR